MSKKALEARLVGADLVSKEGATMWRVLRALPACDPGEECETILYELIEFDKSRPIYLPLEKIVEGYYIQGKCKKGEEDE